MHNLNEKFGISAAARIRMDEGQQVFVVSSFHLRRYVSDSIALKLECLRFTFP